VADRGDELMEGIREELRLSREQHADLRQFIRDMNLRAERVTRGIVKELRQLGRRHDELGGALLEEMRDQRQEMRDLREDSRAQTQALLRMLDRLPPRPQPD